MQCIAHFYLFFKVTNYYVLNVTVNVLEAMFRMTMKLNKN